jgi:uncharacterized protein (TIGR03000 family)
MRRTLLLGVVPVLGLLGLLLLPQDAQAQRWRGDGGRWDGGRYGDGYYGGFGFGRGYYGSPYGLYGSNYYPGNYYGSSYYYPTSGYTYYDNSNYGPAYSGFGTTMQNAYYSDENQGQYQDVIFDGSGQAWSVPGETRQENPNLIFMEVRVPQDAQLWINNQETRMRGTERMFFSPPVTPGRTYSYELKATWNDPSGQQVTRTRTVNVRAGQITPVDLMNAQQNTTQPVYQQPNNQQPNNQQPVYQQQNFNLQPTNQPPVNQQQNFQQPNNRQPNNSQPTNQQQNQPRTSPPQT